MAVREELYVEGHLVDSGILKSVFDIIITGGAQFKVKEFNLGTDNQATSKCTFDVIAPDDKVLEHVMDQLSELGVTKSQPNDVELKSSEKDKTAPDEFYSTTNHRSFVRLKGSWVKVEKQRMDAVIVINNGTPECKKLRDVKKGDKIVCGHNGIKVVPPETERDREHFAFMSNDVSSERRVELVVKQLAKDIIQLKKDGGKLVIVSGPVVVHTGGANGIESLIQNGYVDAFLMGNALAVHDIEKALLGTSLGVDVETGQVIMGGHTHHMRAINTINKAGSIEEAVRDGVLKSGIMFELVKHKVPYVMAGSLRDDGPLPGVITDMNEAQDAYNEHVKSASMIIMLSSMLHSIATGNMTQSWVRTVCVDINPAVVTKLSDRGTGQAIGIVTDVGLFCHLLAAELKANR